MLRITLISSAALMAAGAAYAQDGHEGHGAPPAAEAPAQTEQSHEGHEATPAPANDPHAGHGAHAPHGAHDDDVMRAEEELMHPHTPIMLGLYGAYPMGRDASGTSWQPDVSEHGGVHGQIGDWMTMSHVLLNGVYDWQDGSRGDEKAFVAGMVMASARRDVGQSGVLNVRAMLSPDPFMGKDGYPLLFAAGETADGVEPLVDRQHPHDLFMELAASYTHRFDADNSVFIYGGLPGEPAFGPPAFMHRMSAMDSPEAPITHHWFDSTHITFGVVTAGYVHDRWKIEASRFRGREPDEERYDIETGDLDSTALRLSWNPTENLALQVSWADVTSPEALEPDENEERWSTSGIYTAPFGDEGWWSTTLAFSNKERSDGVSLDAAFVESALHLNERWTLFTRAEAIETDELEGHGHGEIHRVSRFSLGAIRDFRIAEHALFGIGALAQQHFAPEHLEASYGGDPVGAMAFVRLKIE